MIVFAFLLLCLLPPSASAGERVKLATTTSTENSGLLDVLLPPFEKRFHITVDVIPVGSGKALKLAENGDVDVVLSHAPDLEERFIREGYGVNRRKVMYNDFLIIGPVRDPARIAGTEKAAAALRKIASTRSLFISRADESGTHQKEKELWRQAGITPEGEWYIEAGQGMGAVLTMAEEKQAYTLTDRGTYLAYREKKHLTLVPLVAGDPALYNPYTVIAVNPARHPHVNYLGAMALIGWLTSPEGQKIIGEYTYQGEPLFHPVAVPP